MCNNGKIITTDSKSEFKNNTRQAPNDNFGVTDFDRPKKVKRLEKL